MSLLGNELYIYCLGHILALFGRFWRGGGDYMYTYIYTYIYVCLYIHYQTSITMLVLLWVD